ncbi:hypothetical protein ACFE04_001326 [Oxalis oulophora]
MIHGNGLKDFNYTGSLKGDYHLFTTSKIANVSLNVPIHNHNCSEAKTVHKLLKGVSDVKNLKLSSNAVKVCFMFSSGPPSEKRVTEFLLSIIPRGSESTDIVLI